MLHSPRICGQDLLRGRLTSTQKGRLTVGIGLVRRRLVCLNLERRQRYIHSLGNSEKFAEWFKGEVSAKHWLVYVPVPTR